MKKALCLLVVFCGVAFSQGIAPIVVTEGDGSPRIGSVTKIIVTNGSLTRNGSVATITTGGATPGGSNTQVQYNNAGVFGGISGFTTNGTRVNFGANPLLNVGSGATDNLFYVGSAASGAVNASFGFFVAGVGSGSATEGPYFLARGNTFSAIGDQRGMMYFAAGNVGTPVGNDGTIRFLTGTETERLQITPAGTIRYFGLALGSLGTPADGNWAYCNDCLEGSDPCTASSTGTFAMRLNGRWKCL